MSILKIVPLQYVGDARIQALITYLATGDDRFGRQAIRQFEHSRSGSGLTLSRYPKNFPQIIPEFSLFWILMIRDHFEHFHDPEIILEHWNGIRDVIDSFLKHRLKCGLISQPGEWNFSDWVQDWSGGRSNHGTTQTIIHKLELPQDVTGFGLRLDLKSAGVFRFQAPESGRQFPSSLPDNRLCESVNLAAARDIRTMLLGFNRGVDRYFQFCIST